MWKSRPKLARELKRASPRPQRASLVNRSAWSVSSLLNKVNTEWHKMSHGSLVSNDLRIQCDVSKPSQTTNQKRNCRAKGPACPPLQFWQNPRQTREGNTHLDDSLNANNKILLTNVSLYSRNTFDTSSEAVTLTRKSIFKELQRKSIKLSR